jgi:hypothetical protein
MSVSSLIKLSEVRARLDLLVPRGSYQCSMPYRIQVPVKTKVHSSIIGTAYDYALRFELARISNNVKHSSWIAEKSIEILKHRLNMYKTKGYAAIDELDQYAPEMIYRVASARSFFERHRQKKTCAFLWMKALAKHCLKLARIDPYYRTGYWGPALIGEDDAEAISEVIEMLRITPWTHWSTAKSLILNGNFGKFSHAVGGADYDLVVDDTLIDVKTTKHLRVSRDTVRQITMYLILSDLAREDDPNHFPQINRLNIYFSRYALVWDCAANSIRQNSAYEDTKRWLLDYACQKFKFSNCG